ncbi:MAG: 2-amino-4-hydroxy-6-hydroxymethyldihydropteridine diphosphokinase [Anaerolineales bacterium]|jgi:2-amino-4-hydroxy-6-hydroxymethyldihydropteridine diphosphokinase|nr:2-amino-4-hydroxy-6-hydroxymethyldihydropteridine diphosphokinase [Anaerolineales bacterium]WKZ40780.1 MAG: 2-amino-4-hydroxy-6-hydroxymethyldihydropteridine diphosphokinase [Anaerolineales bacterium]
MVHTVYIALGSNMGSRLANLKNAISNLAPQMTVKKKSPVYETPPWGYANQPAFLNQVVMAETYLEADALLGHLKRLETALGREPSFQNGPRLIDMDILFYDDLILDSEPLSIPHPRLHQRAFVLVPLNDIAPDLVHPVLGKPVSELLLDVDRLEIVEYKGK